MQTHPNSWLGEGRVKFRLSTEILIKLLDPTSAFRFITIQIAFAAHRGLDRKD